MYVAQPPFKCSQSTAHPIFLMLCARLSCLHICWISCFHSLESTVHVCAVIVYGFPYYSFYQTSLYIGGLLSIAHICIIPASMKSSLLALASFTSIRAKRKQHRLTNMFDIRAYAYAHRYLVIAHKSWNISSIHLHSIQFEGTDWFVSIDLSADNVRPTYCIGMINARTE